MECAKCKESAQLLEDYRQQVEQASWLVTHYHEAVHKMLERCNQLIEENEKLRNERVGLHRAEEASESSIQSEPEND